MSNNTNLSKLASVLDDGSSGQYLKSTGSGGVVFDTVAAGAVVYATPDLLPLTGNSAGDMAYVTSTNRFYINNGSGWYSVGLVNTTPNITSAQDASSNSTPFTFETNGTALVITITASDPEEVPITYGYSVTSGSLTNGGGTTATVAQGTGSNVNKFTVTPSTTEAYAGTFEITFTASDGINQATSANSFTLSFITTISNSRYTVLLAEGQGSGDNSTFDDAATANSGNGHTLTKQRSSTSVDYPVANSFSPYRYGGYSVEFQGTNQSLRTHTFPSSLYLGTENFSWEFWVKTPSLSGTNKVVDHQTNNGSLEFHLYSNRAASFHINGSSFDFPSSSALDTETWYHLSVTKEGNFARGFVNGTQVHSQSITDSSLNSTTHISLGGQHNHNSTVEKGLKMHDLRIVKGSVLHENNSGTYTYPVPTAPLEEVTGTFLTAYRLPYLAYKRQTASDDATLIIENMNHIQGSNSSGPPATVPDTPYDGDENTSGTGSSVYFPENGYIDIGSSFSGTDFNGNFTCEFWIYLTEKFYTSESTIFAMTGGTIAQVKIDSSQYLSGFKQQARNSEKLPTRCWNHVVMSRSGSTINFYVNGERMQRSENSGFSGNSSSKIGARIDGSTRLKNAYISDFRLTAGTALYTAASIVPPTEPLNTPSGTSLHMKGNDGAITDKNASSELLLKPRSGSGQPAGDTTDVVYNSSTIYSNCFSMTGGGTSGVETAEYIQVPNMTKLEGTEDFTVEAFIYPTNISSYQVLFEHGTFSLAFGKSGGNNVFYSMVNSGFSDGVGGSTAYGTYSIPNNQWSFVQMIRDSGIFKCYHNGTLRWIANYNSHQNSSVTTTNTPTIGAMNSGGERFKGKIQGLRVSKGIVRPTTVPTAPFKG